MTSKDTNPIVEKLGVIYDMISDLPTKDPIHNLIKQEMMDRIAMLTFAQTIFWYEGIEACKKALKIFPEIQD